MVVDASLQTEFKLVKDPAGNQKDQVKDSVGGVFFFDNPRVIGPLTHPHNPLGAPENRPGKNTPQYPPGRLEPGTSAFVRQGHRPTELPVRDRSGELIASLKVLLSTRT